LDTSSPLTGRAILPWQVFRAHADVLRLALGCLSHLAGAETGRSHVIGSRATAAVVLAMRAHGSDVPIHGSHSGRTLHCSRALFPPWRVHCVRCCLIWQVSILDEACRFVAALAYGGPSGRRAALDAKADTMLRTAIKRFGGEPSFAQVLEMAKVILKQLETAPS
jgi:hypothetical protein